MEKFEIYQIKNKILAIKELQLVETDIVDITEQSGGLVNYVFRIETTKGLLFLKQFLSELKYEAFKNLELGPTSRIKLSFDVENKFEEILGRNSGLVPHVYFCDFEEGYMVIEGFKNVESLFTKITNGEFPEKLLINLATVIAKIHQQTFYQLNNENFYNNEWLGLKLKYQYFELAKLLDNGTAEKLNKFADNYKNNKLVLTHGDLCSINIFADKNDPNIIRLIDFEDAHIGTPAFDLGYLLSELLVAAEYYKDKRSEIIDIMKKFLNTYFSIFDKQDRLVVEKEITKHAASLMLYRVFGISKDIFSAYIKDENVKNIIKEKSGLMINSNQSVNEFLK